jgi:hypothetical protein
MTEKNILNGTWDLTRDIDNYFQQREKYQNLINDIHQNRWSLIAGINNKALQFAGLLVINHQRNHINQNYVMKITDDLSPQEVKDIEDIFKDFHQINLLCLRSLLKQYPELEIPLLHYCEYDFPIPCIGTERKINLIDRTKIEAFVKIFEKHPSFEIIQSNINLLKDRSPQYIESRRRPLEKEIETGEIDKAPSFVRFNILDEKSLEKRILKLFFAIICLRKSIMVLNELLFMQILYDRLPVIDDSNLLAPPRWYSNTIRNGVHISCLQNNKNSGLGSRNWIFYMAKKSGFDTTVINFCTTVRVSSTQDFGEEVELTADNIDKNLNLYPTLLSP